MAKTVERNVTGKNKCLSSKPGPNKKLPGAANILTDILNDKTIKLKKRVDSIASLILSEKVTIGDIIKTAQKESDPNKASLIESLEHASRVNSSILNGKDFEFLIENLGATAARIKWESARTLANTAQHIPKKLLEKAVGSLLENTEDPGMVVRWSAAGALIKIIQCKTPLNEDLVPALEAIEKREEDKAIKKIYQQGLKKLAK